MGQRKELIDNLVKDFKAGNELARKYDDKVLKKYVTRMIYRFSPGRGTTGYRRKDMTSLLDWSLYRFYNKLYYRLNPLHYKQIMK